MSGIIWFAHEMERREIKRFFRDHLKYDYLDFVDEYKRARQVMWDYKYKDKAASLLLNFVEHDRRYVRDMDFYDFFSEEYVISYRHGHLKFLPRYLNQYIYGDYAKTRYHYS